MYTFLLIYSDKQANHPPPHTQKNLSVGMYFFKTEEVEQLVLLMDDNFTHKQSDVYCQLEFWLTQ